MRKVYEKDVENGIIAGGFPPGLVPAIECHYLKIEDVLHDPWNKFVSFTGGYLGWYIQARIHYDDLFGIVEALKKRRREILFRRFDGAGATNHVRRDRPKAD